MKAQVGEDIDIYARGPCGDFGEPLLAVGGLVAVVREFQVLKTHSYGESEVEPFLVGVRAVEYLVAGARHSREGRAEQSGRGKQRREYEPASSALS